MSNEIVVHIDMDLEDLIPDYLNNRAKDLETIATELNQDNLAEVQRVGHMMKGSGSGYGFDEITRIGSDMEEAAKQGNKDALVQLRQELETYLQNLKIVYVEEE